jgi:hypothetical protein
MDINGLSGLIRMNGYIYIYNLWETNIAIENGHLWLIYPLKMVIFHSYVSLPEGKTTIFPWFSYDFPIKPPFSYDFPMDNQWTSVRCFTSHPPVFAEIF